MLSIGKKCTKPKSSAWKFFKRVTELDIKTANSLLVKYQCIYCEARYSGHATRLTKHLSRSCRRCPRSVAAKFTRLLKSKVEEKQPQNAPSKTDANYDGNSTDRYEFDDALDDDRTSLENSLLQENFRYYSSDVPSNSTNSRVEFISERLYTRAFCSGGLSLNFNENEYWREFLNHLNPQFKIPSKIEFVQQLLPREYSEIEENVREKIDESPMLCLQCFISSDEQDIFVVNFVINTPKPLFCKSITVSCNDELTCHVQREVMSIMNNFGSDKFVAVLTNNPSIFDLFNQTIFNSSDVVRFNCVISSLNLLVRDILNVESASLLWINLQEMVEEIREEVPELYSNSKSLKKDDWESVYYYFDSVIDNEKMLKSLVSSPEIRFSKNIQEIISNNEFWCTLKKLYAVIEPILNWLNNLSSIETGISNILKCFHEIKANLDSSAPSIFSRNEVELIQRLFSHSKYVTITPLHLSANILNPRLNGLYLSDDEQILGSEYIDKISSIMYKNNTTSANEVLCELAKYRCQEGIFKVPYVLKTVDELPPEIWWKGSCYGLKLSKVADFILSLPASTVVLENLLKVDFSDLKKHDLSPEQMSQYIYINQNLKLMHPPWFNSVENTTDNEESDSKDEKLMEEEDISDVEYELSLEEITCDD